MNSNIIQVLVEIKLSLYILLGVTTLSAIANIVRAWVVIKGFLQKEDDTIFSRLYEKGNLDVLFGYCEENLKHRPNHSYALFGIKQNFFPAEGLCKS